MKQEIELYIANDRVEFDTDPRILYTYQQTEIENPTVIKNSFSKTVTIKGTDNNNKIFGQYWNLQRIEGDGRNGNGVSFNASKKVDFTLYVNGEVCETGYAKLDSVNCQSNDVTYNLTLYGGLGEFFYNLSTNDNTGEQLKLSDLDFMGTPSPETEFDYTINMDTVKTAWDNINNPYSPKWNTINFMPCYNGLPEEFDAGKCLINTTGTELPTVEEKKYKTKNGFVIAELPAELTEHEIRDYRSYLMRPVIRMKSIVEACCDQKNNGGYTVELDDEFFSDSNPYWTDTWLTLPMISNLDIKNTNQVMTAATLTASTTVSGTSSAECYQTFGFDMGEFNPEVSSIVVGGKVKMDVAYHNTSYAIFAGKKSDKTYDNWNCFGSLYCQLLAYNGDTVVGASESYNLTSPIRHNGKLYYGNNSRYDTKGKYEPNPYNTKIFDAIGTPYQDGWKYEDGSIREFYFHIDYLASNVTSLKMRYWWGSSSDKRKKFGVNYVIREAYDDNSISPIFEAQDGEGIPPSSITFDITYKDIQAVIGDSIGHTGTEIKKTDLLNTEASPCDYLLSYCKMFGLYFRKEIDDKKIYIETRKTYYQRDKIIDLENLVDHSKDINITPLTFNTKWLEFNPQNDETVFANRYKLAEGYDYGEKLVNTGYDFDSNKTDILENICIRGGIEGHEKSKYFTAYEKDSTVRPWMVGMKYNLYDSENNTYEVTPSIQVGKVYGINENNGLKYYDLFPKLQFHNEDNSGVDGNNVLVFFCGFKTVNDNRAYNIHYILSDDNQYMASLNDGTPCWLFTTQEIKGGDRLCYNLDSIPVFERYRTIEGSNTIINSLDFGSPRQLYCQGYDYTEESTIYDTYWDTYISDLYDVNTKILSCSVLMDEKPSPEWLRKFYWYENCIWRLNKISDWNVASYEPVKMEFIKVQEVGDYTNRESEEVKTLSFTLNKYRVPMSGETLHATIVSNTFWQLYWSEEITPEITSGFGTTTFDVLVPSVSDNKRHQYTITARADVSATVTILQDVEGEIFIMEDSSTIGVDVPSSGGSVSINVKSIYPWTLTADKSFVSFDKNSGSGNTEDGEEVVVTFSESDSMDYRTITVTARDSFGNTGLWSKNQNAATTVYYPWSGGSKTIALEQSGATFVLPDWLSVVDNGDGTYTLTAKENTGDERTNGVVATVRRTPVTRGDISNIVYIIDAIQEAGQGGGDKEFSVSPSTLQFAYSGSSAFLSITDTVGDNWKITTAPEWVTYSQGYGSGSAFINITATSNPSTSPRSDALIVLNVTKNKEYTINCYQFGSDSTRTFIVNPTVINALQEGGDYDITLTYTNRGDDFLTYAYSGDGGVVVKKVEWFEDSGTGIITVEPNRTTDTKTTVVSLIPNETDPKTVTVIQEAGGEYLYVNPLNIIFDYSGGTATFVIDTNANSWTIEGIHTHTLTGISMTISSVSDIPASGGTVSKYNCIYTVTGHYDDGTQEDITNLATVTGSLSASSSTDETRHYIGDLPLVASYEGFFAHAEIAVYQEAYDEPHTITGLTIIISSVSDIPASGGTVDKYNSIYTVTAKYSDGTREDVTNLANVTGSLSASSSTDETRHYVGSLALTASYRGMTATDYKPVYQEAYVVHRTLTGITMIIASVEDIPASGGTVDRTNCIYSVSANYSDGTREDITYSANVTGSLSASSSTDETRHYIGSLALTASYGGFTSTDYRPVYQEAFTLQKYVAFRAIQDSTIYLFGSGDVMLQYSYNGSSWIDWDFDGLTVEAGQNVYIRGNNPNGFNTSDNSRYFYITGSVACSGNIMHLLDYTQDLLDIPNADCFTRLFYGCTGLTQAPDLPATGLTEWCYTSMFYGCTNLVNAPELPATTLADGCYYHMFEGSGLVTAPELPATTLAEECYSSMFANCSSLTTASELPAVDLAYGCYEYMFSGCTSLTTAPVLSADTLVDSCYSYMFRDCSSLNDITMLATTIGSYSLFLWVAGVASEGMFRCISQMREELPIGDSGIPENWLIIEL